MHPHVDLGDHHDEYSRVADLLRRAPRVAVLTGAGVSAESGVPTFRGAGGLWEGHHVEEVACPEAFERDPSMVWRFYNLRRNAMHGIQPNPGHHALAQMQQRWGPDRFTLVTQNIDGLHHAAGSRQVLELHGRLSRVRCTHCTYLADRPGEILPDLPRCPQCQELLRPDIVWFGEVLPQDIWQEAYRRTAACACFLVVGTSAIVYPAAGLIHLARSAGASVVEFNLEQTAASTAADVSLFGPSGVTLPEVLRHL